MGLESLVEGGRGSRVAGFASQSSPSQLNRLWPKNIVRRKTLAGGIIEPAQVVLIISPS